MVREVRYRQKEMERKDGNFDIIGPVMVGLSALLTRGGEEWFCGKEICWGEDVKRQGSPLYGSFLQPGKGMERIRHLWQDSWGMSPDDGRKC